MCSHLTCGVVPLTDDVVEAAVCFLVRLLHLVQGLLEVELQLVYLLQHQTAATGAPLSGALWAGRDKRDMNTFEKPTTQVLTSPHRSLDQGPVVRVHTSCNPGHEPKAAGDTAERQLCCASHLSC